MSAENEALALRVYEILGRGDTDRLGEVYAENVQYHGPGGEEVSGVEGMKQFTAPFLAAFSDMHIHVDEIPSIGDKVITRTTGHGTHTGELMGVPPSGNHMAAAGLSIMQIRDGKIVEEWEIFDLMHMMQQIGGISS